MVRICVTIACLSFITVAHAATPKAAPPKPDVAKANATKKVDFVREVQPILANHCVKCHGPEKQKGGLRLDVKSDAFKQLDSGKPAVTRNQGKESLLIELVRGNEFDEIMPPKGKGKPLTPAQIATLTRWIDQGADWPDSASAKAIVTSKHWSYQPVVRTDPPQVKQANWPANSIDRFVLARLESKGIKPSPQADRYTLIKRLYYDLLGVTPTIAEVDAFVNDKREGAYERLVNRLLASKHFGERWGRHWLDKARYADSDGYEKDRPRMNAWRYRDWVIDAINSDMPFDQFTIEQLAGDLLPNPTPMQRLATAFHRQTLTNTEGGTDQEQFRVEATFDRSETTATIWLGLTLTCARCHTHKYDQITQREYYELYAFFNNSDEANATVARDAAAMTGYLLNLKGHLRQVAKVEQQLATATKDLGPALEAWERVIKTKIAAGQPELKFHDVKVLAIAGPNDVNFKRQDDGSYLATGANADSGKYTIDLETDLQDISGVRLDVLPDNSLGSNGPGRTKHGNFVLSEIRLYASGKGTPTSKDQITVKNASSDFSQDGWAIEKAIDGKEGTGVGDSGWAIAPQFGKPHHAIFSTANVFPAQPKTFVRVVLSQSYGSQHMIGRFRIRLQTGVDYNQLAPKPIRAILALPVKERTAAHQKALLDHFAATHPSTVKLAEQLASLKKKAPKQPTMTVRVIGQRGNPRQTKMLRRGDFLQPLDEVKPQTINVLETVHPLKSRLKNAMPDRLDLARWLMDKDNPLTPRVTVNHIWKHLFGHGIVGTMEDFGVRGDMPTHPQLLDWLASETVRLGWSRKAIIKTIVMSATYQQSSHHRPELANIDPLNALLYRQNRFRVEGEVVRDLYLAASGLLSDKVGGPSVYPPMPSDVAALSYANNFKWNTSKGEDRFRRGMYTFFKRTSPHPNLINFDCPDSNTTRVARVISNTALQPLQTLNNITFVEASQAMAKRVLTDTKGNDAQRLSHAIRLCVARPATAIELERFGDLLKQARAYYASHTDDAKKLVGDYAPTHVPVNEAAAWVATLRMVMNVDEFVTRE